MFVSGLYGTTKDARKAKSMNEPKMEPKNHTAGQAQDQAMKASELLL